MLSQLIRAIQEENVDAVSALLKAGANPNDCEDLFKITPLHFAARMDSDKACEIARCLLAAGADPNAGTYLGDQTPFDIAIESCCFKMADVLRGQQRQIPKDIFKKLTAYNTKKREEALKPKLKEVKRIFNNLTAEERLVQEEVYAWMINELIKKGHPAVDDFFKKK